MPKSSLHINIPGLVINRKNKTPAYRQIYEGLRNIILNRQIREGQRLPSSRILAEDLGISRNIVLLAYEQLALEGYINSGVGSGSYVSKNLDQIMTGAKHKTLPPAVKGDEAKSLVNLKHPLSENINNKESEKSSVIPFQNGIPSFDQFPFKQWVKCANKVFREFEFLHLGYDDAQGFYPLRQSIAAYLRTNRALQCEPEQIIITNGAQQAINMIAKLLVKKNDLFWMEDPGYVNAKAAFMEEGASPCYIPLTKNGINVDWAIKNYPKANLVYLTPSNQFPTGGTLPLSKRIQLLNWAHKNNMWIIEDDYDSEFRYSKKPVASLQGLDNYGRVIYLGTFSKILFPALRIGYLVLPSVEIAKSFSKAKSFFDRQNSITDQAILHEFMKEDFFASHLRKMRILYKKRQDFLCSQIDKYGKGIIRVEKQDSGMHLIGWLPDGTDDKMISDSLQTYNIISTPLSRYANKFKTKPGLILGYTSFNEKYLKEYSIKLISLLKKIPTSSA